MENIKLIGSENILEDQMKRIILDGNVRVTIEANTYPPPSRFLRVGVLRQNKNIWKPQHTICAMFYVAAQFNIELFLFSINDVDFINKTINGTFLEGNTKVQRRVPFPRIIDNAILYGEDGLKLELLERDCYLIRHSLNTTKQKVYDMLLQEGTFKGLLIESQPVNNFEHFLTLLAQYNNDVILKPLRGARGIGVARITFADGKYVVNVRNEKILLNTVDEFAKFYDYAFTKRTHILQPYITSRTHQGNPFDIRVHARRGAGGKFKVDFFPRIGNENGIVSNISVGGYSMDISGFLKTEFGDKASEIINDNLIKFGKIFPDYYQSFFPMTIFDIGVDVGIQKHDDYYEFKIFEVNTYIDGPFFEIEDAITHFEYYRYIDQKLRGI